MTHAVRVPSSSTRMAPRLSRRAIVRNVGGLGLSLMTVSARGPRPVRASPVVTVATPKILDIMECIAPVTVEVTLSGLRWVSATKSLATSWKPMRLKAKTTSAAHWTRK